MLKRIFAKAQELTGGCSKLYNMNSSQNIITAMKLNCNEHVANMGYKRDIKIFFAKNPE
jgi:hypothetical protein